MLVLIPLLTNDYLLLVADLFIIALSFSLKYESKELVIFVCGAVVMTLAETLFLKTGVEVFQRTSLFGIMPIWLPVLWGYGFVAIKRFVLILKLN